MLKEYLISIGASQIKTQKINQNTGTQCWEVCGETDNSKDTGIRI